MIKVLNVNLFKSLADIVIIYVFALISHLFLEKIHVMIYNIRCISFMESKNERHKHCSA